jgi:hypothetical protein
MGMCLLSYGGKTRAGIVVDSAILPNSEDTAAFTESFEHEIVLLASLCGIPEDLVFHNR